MYNFDWYIERKKKVWNVVKKKIQPLWDLELFAKTPGEDNRAKFEPHFPKIRKLAAELDYVMKRYEALIQCERFDDFTPISLFALHPDM